MHLEYGKRPLPIVMPEYMHQLLGYAADLDGSSMASFARAAIMAAVEIRIDEHTDAGGQIPSIVLPYWIARDEQDWRPCGKGRRPTKGNSR